MKCFDCPRNCGVDRTKKLGFCRERDKIRVAKIIENFMWEEPCISGNKGALAIFFSGCNLKCSFCQNREISHIGKGELYSSKEFRKLILSYDLTQFSTIDLVTPSHFSSLLIEAFAGLKLPIPVVWNSSAYEKEDMIERISEVVDVFLPDLKFFDSTWSKDVAKAEDYFAVASKAICAMKRAKPKNKFSEGTMKEGVLIRHLVLPQRTKDSFNLLDFIKKNIDAPYISLMCQFIPLGKHFSRKIFPLEYKAVLAYADKIGLKKGFAQDFGSADDKFVPNF